MKRVIIIPARYASSRFPGKPLEFISGQDGKSRTLIEHTWRAAQNVAGIDAVFIATDDERIAHTCQEFGGDVIMTSTNCKNGTERCAEALARMDEYPEIIVNLQGDAPLTPPWFIESIIARLDEASDCVVATPVLRCDQTLRQNLLNDRKRGVVGGTSAVFDKSFKSLYFSKEVLPYGDGEIFHHVGVYAYRPTALTTYIRWPESELEKSEGLEQLRFVENGFNVQCVEVEAKGRDFWEVNNPEDIKIVENILGAIDVE